MAKTLTGRRVAILAARGVEQVELVQPREAVTEAGATTELLSLKPGTIQATNHDLEPADQFEVDRVVSEISFDDYDALILPGGTVNPDTLRQDSAAVAFVRDFVQAGKPVGVICHGPWTLVEADVVRGGTVLDQEVVIDGNIVSSRRPDDLPAFCRAIVAHFAAVGVSS
jgi:protease I